MDDQLQDLVESARAGDEEAWSLLYRRVYPRLRAYVSHRAGPEHTEDLVSETMTRAVGSMGRFTLGAAGFDGWVFGIARRVTADHHRRAARARRHAGSAAAVSTDHSAPLDEGLVVLDEHDAVQAAFGRLSNDDQELLHLRVVAQLSADDTAKVLGKRPGAIRTAQSRALARLRRLLEQDDA